MCFRLTMSRLISDHSSKTIHLAKNFREKWSPALAKQIAKYEALVQELIGDPLAGCMEVDVEAGDPQSSAGPELSVHAQYILDDCLEKIKALLNEMLNEHRGIHPPISKCGKDLDRYFQSDLGNLMKNEKAIESNPDNLQRANRLIYDHLMSLGRVEVAETFARESELKLVDQQEVVNEENVRKMREVMESLRAGNYLPAIEWVRAHRAASEDLLFRLHSQYMIQLLLQGKFILHIDFHFSIPISRYSREEGGGRPLRQELRPVQG